MMRILIFPKMNRNGKFPSGSKASPLEIQKDQRRKFDLHKESKKAKIWIDFENPNEEDLYFLSQNCGFHPLAIEDCVNRNQRPKFEDYEDHAFIVLHNFSSPPGSKQLLARETHAFFNHNFIVTVHEHHENIIDTLWNRCCSEASLVAKGTDHLLYVLFDFLVDSNFPILDEVSDGITDLENQILTKEVQPDFVTDMLFLKRNLVRMRRVLSPQREVLNLIMRHENKFLTQRIRFYFRDVYDHLSRLVETIDMDRDLIGNSMDAYFSLLSQKTNEIIKKLTLVSMVFLPLTFLTGFFGMNFTDLPFSSDIMFWITIATIGSIPAWMMLYFRRKKWFNE
ncbi:magnesium/cobalt transporter CorA [Leptospira broomii]|nr:magnesium/cobalt transporter CorA [Leptospira broomii]